jgi:hypothetical protein
LASAGVVPGNKPVADAVKRSLYHTYNGVFFAIAALSGHDHWQLAENEAGTLAELTDRALAGQKKTKAMKKVIGYLPALALVTTAAGIVGTRVAESYATIRQKKSSARADAGSGERWPDERYAVDRPAASGSGGPVSRGSPNPSSAAGLAIRSLVDRPFS